MLYLHSTSQLAIINTTLSFLDLDDLTNMTEIAMEHHLNSNLFRVAIVKALMGKYLNKVDRSVFFLFYEDQDFLSIEKNTINTLAQQTTSFLGKIYQGYP